ncbi:DUF1661 domain-containing protein [Porphyromonas sp. COT-052 OH4946]|uniref:DUF1661 domain-containing protein n=1 Tax=Porphyromonas sp. COT-052 OH4946 TaxID=1515618 RepID=UPI0009E014B9|nr:DUF1661 domain-containing protein [Porphyromonas sp. COT-052 OH4946]
MAREVKNLRATAKKISRHFSRKYAPQSQHFRSVNFGEADLSAKKNYAIWPNLLSFYRR